MPSVSKVPFVNNSSYAIQSRARHKHQEKPLARKLAKIQKEKLKNTKNYDSFLSSILSGLKKESSKIVKKIAKLIKF